MLSKGDQSVKIKVAFQIHVSNKLFQKKDRMLV